MAEAEGARTVQVQHSLTSSKAILRIKRKRSADPADILLVSHAFKKLFTDKDHQLISDSNDSVQRIFRLAGTVSKKNHEPLPQEILTKLSSNDGHKSKVKINPKNELTVDAINEKLRDTKRLARQTSRYKVVSKRRDIEDNVHFEDVEGNDEVDAAGQEMLNLYQLYDVVLDEAEARNVDPEDVDPNAILCNSVKMIREKLRIDEAPKTNLEILEKDYVYDVYCAEDNYGAVSEVLDIVHLNESQLITYASDEELNDYEDDDDSNDENNWRNDYPDEDEWNCSSDEEQRYRNEDFDYDYDGRRMLRELSSDEEKDYAYYENDDDDYDYEILDEEYTDLTS